MERLPSASGSSYRFRLGVNIRKSYSTSSDILGAIPYSSSISVKEKSSLSAEINHRIPYGTTLTALMEADISVRILRYLIPPMRPERPPMR